MMRLSFTQALELAVFLLIPGEARRATAQKSGNGNRRDNIIVSLLVCLLLLLLVLLFLAWRYLNRKSEGRYLPQRLMRGLVLRWQAFWGQTHSEELTHGQEEYQSDEESREQHDDEEEEEQWGELLLQRAGSECEEEKQERLDKSTTSEPLEKKAELESEEDEEDNRASRATEGRAETLLSDLHSFSGTATWEDSGKPTHVTAL